MATGLKGFVSMFARHKVAANMMMIIMMLMGVWALSGLNTQFFPNFALGMVNIQVEWLGASAEDVETAITTPIEQELKDLSGVRKQYSTSREGFATITLEFEDHIDVGVALDDVKERVSRVRNLPADAEDPKVIRIARYDTIARVILRGDLSRTELRGLAYELEAGLLDRGIAKVDVIGLPEQEIAIQISNQRLAELGLSLDEVARMVQGQSQDVPAGEVGGGDVARQLRSLDQRRSPLGFENLTLQVDAQGNVLRLSDIAEVAQRPKDDQILMSSRDLPSIELWLQRADTEDALAAARVLDGWLADVRPTLPSNVELVLYDERWQYIEDRIMLLLKNGATGLLLVVIILFLFLNGRVAWWVTVGIPTSFLAALAALYLYGGSINMISLFGLIMTLGIIVDDAIVVGEDALTHFERGESATEAAEGGAFRMLAPVFSSSLTTIAAFLPLLAIGGIYGSVLFDIPLVVICVIIASLIESFLVLPGHLRHTFTRAHFLAAREGKAARRGIFRRVAAFKQGFDDRFNRFREGRFRRWVRASLRMRGVTVAAAVAALILAIALPASGVVKFVFFPQPESPTLVANVSFVAGTPQSRVDAFMRQVGNGLLEAEQALGGDLVINYVTLLGTTFSPDDPWQIRTGEHHGSLVVELTSPDTREIRNPALIRAWQARVREMPGIESFVIKAITGGPPGLPIDFKLTGADADTLKAASTELQDKLKTYAGVFAVGDDLPYGQEQLIYELTPEGRALGISVDWVGAQLRAAFAGRLVQIFHKREDEVEVRVQLTDAEQASLASLLNYHVTLPSGATVPLSNLITLNARRGFEVLRHSLGKLAVHVTADVDSAAGNAEEIRADLAENYLPELRRHYGIQTIEEGQAADQQETQADMGRGLIFALALIYLILAWVFASYGWPLIVMAIIPFGLVGAFFGHFVMGIDLTLLSMFGMFGLTGILVNDSIILVTFYKELREKGVSVREALEEAAVLRLRAVLLTSLTTIGGLLPLLFETSLQAQFLIPMAATISFGLAGATFLVLFLIPCLLSFYESALQGSRSALGWSDHHVPFHPEEE